MERAEEQATQRETSGREALEGTSNDGLYRGLNREHNGGLQVIRFRLSLKALRWKQHAYVVVCVLVGSLISPSRSLSPALARLASRTFIGCCHLCVCAVWCCAV